MFDCRCTVRTVVPRRPRSRTACPATYEVGVTDNEPVVVTATAAPAEVTATAGAKAGVSDVSPSTTEARIARRRRGTDGTSGRRRSQQPGRARGSGRRRHASLDLAASRSVSFAGTGLLQCRLLSDRAEPPK